MQVLRLIEEDEKKDDLKITFVSFKVVFFQPVLEKREKIVILSALNMSCSLL